MDGFSLLRRCAEEANCRPTGDNLSVRANARARAEWFRPGASITGDGRGEPADPPGADRLALRTDPRSFERCESKRRSLPIGPIAFEQGGAAW